MVAAQTIIYYFSRLNTADHNQYVHNDYVWQSNYCAGLRVLDEAGMSPALMKERAYFDVAPECDTAVFSGECREATDGRLCVACFLLHKWF